MYYRSSWSTTAPRISMLFSWNIEVLHRQRLHTRCSMCPFHCSRKPAHGCVTCEHRQQHQVSSYRAIRRRLLMALLAMSDELVSLEPAASFALRWKQSEQNTNNTTQTTNAQNVYYNRTINMDMPGNDRQTSSKTSCVGCQKQYEHNEDNDNMW